MPGAPSAGSVPRALHRLCLRRLPLRRRLGLLGLDDRVRAREDQAGVTVVEPDHVGRLATGVAHLDDLPHPVGMSHDVPPHVQPVADYSMHMSTSFIRLTLTRLAPG